MNLLSCQFYMLRVIFVLGLFTSGDIHAPLFADELAQPAVKETPMVLGQHDIVVAIRPSRLQPEAGSHFSMTAKITNVSSHIISLTSTGTTLILPPELQGSAALGELTYSGYFSTEAWGTSYNPRIEIRPNDSYTIVWSWLESSEQSQAPSSMAGNQVAPDVKGSPEPIPDVSPTMRLPLQAKQATEPDRAQDGYQSTISKPQIEVRKSWFRYIQAELPYLNFQPGDYEVAVNIQYETSDDDNVSVQHMTTQGAIIHVVAPEWVILFGSAIGGFVGFILTSTYSHTGDVSKKKASQVLGSIVGSVLLSMIVTILLSRLSETQFLIRVNVNDLWGAVAVGFVVNLAGIKILDRFLPSNGDQSAGAIKP